MIWFLAWALFFALGPSRMLAAEGSARGPSGNEDRGRTAASPAIGRNLQSPRLAIEDLIATFVGQYPRGREYLARLDALLRSGAGSDSAEFAVLQREALLTSAARFLGHREERP